ncbi:unnamed protein product [Amoebophrya sp. A120]|nr:unnamed protein product [Amoebophrya sp. A120]|eukprot:GSA120T00009573001.1
MLTSTYSSLLISSSWKGGCETSKSPLLYFSRKSSYHNLQKAVKSIVAKMFFHFLVLTAVLLLFPATNFYAATAAPLNTARDLHRQYHNIFRYGNRNAASHLWVSFLLKSENMKGYKNFAKMEEMFTAFCPISGSPVNPNDYNRYGLALPVVPELAVTEAMELQAAATGAGGTQTSSNQDPTAVVPAASNNNPNASAATAAPDAILLSTANAARFGFLHYCCWPCVCDTQDFLRVDSKTITLPVGKNKLMEKKYYFVVIGNPCEKQSHLDKQFYQRFDGRQTTLRREAPEVRCDEDNNLIGATYSDHGYVIIGMFFDSEPVTKVPTRYTTEFPKIGDDFSYVQPGRPSYKTVSVSAGDEVKSSSDETAAAVVKHGEKREKQLQFMNESDFDQMCAQRKAQGYNSGMGEIFRKVAEIAPIFLPLGIEIPRDASATNGLVGGKKLALPAGVGRFGAAVGSSVGEDDGDVLKKTVDQKNVLGVDATGARSRISSGEL